MRLRALGLAALLAGCAGSEGTLSVALTTAPGSLLLDEVQHLRLTLTAPRQVVEADRTSAGFDLSLDFEATGSTGAVIVEGFDDGGQLVATGQSPPFPVTSINARVVVYMARPMTVAPAPQVLSPARGAVTAGQLSYGVIFAGGVDGNGAPSDAIAIYNAYDHSVVGGQPMPAARADLQIGIGNNGVVFLYGGFDAAHAATGTFLRFDTTVAPNGAYADLGEQAGLPRAGESAVAIGVDHFLVTGTPPLEIAANTVTARTDIASLPPTGTAVVADGEVIAIFAGPQGIVRVRGTGADVLSTTPRVGAGIAVLPDGRIAIAGGTAATDPDHTLIVVTPATGQVVEMATGLATARMRPGVAATPRHLVVTGGSDAAGAPLASADVLDAALATAPVVVPVTARTAPFAIALPNDQVLIGGGTAPSDVLELFTPPPPPAP